MREGSMAFVRKRGQSFQLIETYRDGMAVRQRVLVNLEGKETVRDALIEALERWNRNAVCAKAERFASGQPIDHQNRVHYERRRDRACDRVALLLRYLPEESDFASIEAEALRDVRRSGGREPGYGPDWRVAEVESLSALVHRLIDVAQESARPILPP